jgi:hypothetical protein
VSKKVLLDLNEVRVISMLILNQQVTEKRPIFQANWFVCKNSYVSPPNAHDSNNLPNVGTTIRVLSFAQSWCQCHLLTSIAQEESFLFGAEYQLCRDAESDSTDVNPETADDFLNYFINTCGSIDKLCGTKYGSEARLEKQSKDPASRQKVEMVSFFLWHWHITMC